MNNRLTHVLLSAVLMLMVLGLALQQHTNRKTQLLLRDIAEHLAADAVPADTGDGRDHVASVAARRGDREAPESGRPADADGRAATGAAATSQATADAAEVPAVRETPAAGPGRAIDPDGDTSNPPANRVTVAQAPPAGSARGEQGLRSHDHPIRIASPIDLPDVRPRRWGDGQQTTSATPAVLEPGQADAVDAEAAAGDDNFDEARLWADRGPLVVEIISDMMGGRYDAVVERFNADVAAALDREKVAAIMDRHRTAHGQLDQVVAHRVRTAGTSDPLHAFDVTVSTTRGSDLRFTIILDRRGRIAGLNLVVPLR